MEYRNGILILKLYQFSLYEYNLTCILFFEENYFCNISLLNKINNKRPSSNSNLWIFLRFSQRLANILQFVFSEGSALKHRNKKPLTIAKTCLEFLPNVYLNIIL